MEPLAAFSDVEARWRPLSSTERVVAETLLADASDMVRARWSDVDTRVAAGTLSASSVVRVVANMVKRALTVGATEGLESQSQVAGPFSVTNRYSNPSANLYVTAEDVRVFEGEPSRARTAWVL